MPRPRRRKPPLHPADSDRPAARSNVGGLCTGRPMRSEPRAVAAFLQGKRIVVAGVSRSGASAANAVFRRLRETGHEVVPVNPNAAEVEGETCYPDVRAVPGTIDGVMVVTHPSARPTSRGQRSNGGSGTSGSTARSVRAACHRRPCRCVGRAASSPSRAAVPSCTARPWIPATASPMVAPAAAPRPGVVGRAIGRIGDVPHSPQHPVAVGPRHAAERTRQAAGGDIGR